MKAVFIAAVLCVVNWPAQSAEPSVEEIYVVRTVRESRIMASTEFCKTGLDSPIYEDQFTLRSVATSASDGRVLDATKTIGSSRFCQQPTAKPFVNASYGEFSLEQLTFKARGDCSRIKADFPEPGLSPYSCVLDLSGLPGEYVGGQLTTNTMSSADKFIGPERKISLLVFRMALRYRSLAPVWRAITSFSAMATLVSVRKIAALLSSGLLARSQLANIGSLKTTSPITTSAPGRPDDCPGPDDEDDDDD